MCRHIKVAAITGGKHVASARFRVRQYIPELQKYGVKVYEFVPPISKYPPPQKWLRPLWGIGAVAVRLPAVFWTYSFDLVLLEREMISTFVTLEPLTKRPRVLDIDDAIFVYRGGKTARRLAELSNLIICGNHFLAGWFSRWNSNVAVIPTAVDTNRFKPNPNAASSGRLIIGWVGSSSNFRYLYMIEGALEKIIARFPQVYLRIIADRKPKFKDSLIRRTEWVRWSPESEILGLQDLTIGIMPLADTEWERGKCSYKMLLYMACGIPVVVSPVGMNAEVLSLGNFGYAANTESEWYDALTALLLMNEKERRRMGLIGRDVVQRYFSIEVLAPRLAQELKRVAV
ncbi:MAG: glycosyltransferase family 4 protein [Thermoproteota archaeon]